MEFTGFRRRYVINVSVILVCICVSLNPVTTQDDEQVAEAMKSTISQNEFDELEEGTDAIRLTPPQLDEEESHSPHMPKSLKCDGCKVIAYQLARRFNAEHEKRPSMKSLTESEVIDIVDEVCSDEFEGYGLKQIDGVKRITGPGMETANAPGIMQGGGRWPLRLKGMCNSYVGELEEFPLYQGYLTDHTMVRFLCEGTGILGDCNRDKDEL